MLVVFVTDDRSNNGTDCNEEQPLNMLGVFATDDRSNNGTDCNA